MLKLVSFMLFMSCLTVEANTGDKALGEALYKKCVSCHGADGLGKPSQKAPMLAGQYAWYIETQIKNIQSGTRSNENTKKMVPFVKNLSEKEIADIAAYIESLPYKK